MQYILSEHAGFCPGVRSADKTVNRLIGSDGAHRIFTLGNLIHNRLYNLELENRGVRSIGIDDVENEFLTAPNLPMTVVIRTHGVTVEVESKL
ncbi:MAG: 4-hydroxy-3-methylbut-2-enyl diphosphate reductase, partial [Clostridia bacterium]|nr:4-hydroxy-3-methylbut-2-enyl diphosphate reductase [Clostridia bacterium]